MMVTAPRTYGVISLNKPAGITSFDAVHAVRSRFTGERVGHAGTLDPVAQGVLPICVGQATRLQDYFHKQPKRYRCVVRLGERSDTLDSEGTITSSGDASTLDEGAVRDALRAFVGDIMQTPPMHSAVRQKGKHLYELAREGIVVERQPRPVTILEATVLSFQSGPVADVTIDVLSGKGTYMRVLAEDLGTSLGVGGYLAQLVRTAYGDLTVENALSLDDFMALDDPGTALLPCDVAVVALPRVDLVPQLAAQIRQGQSVWIPRALVPTVEGICRAHDHLGNLIGLGTLQGNLLRPTTVLGGTTSR